MGPRDGTWHLLALPMQGMPEGQLELVLTLKDEVSRKILEVREPFRIATAQAPQDP
jgi:hypothetical protein